MLSSIIQPALSGALAAGGARLARKQDFGAKGFLTRKEIMRGGVQGGVSYLVNTYGALIRSFLPESLGKAEAYIQPAMVAAATLVVRKLILTEAMTTKDMLYHFLISFGAELASRYGANIVQVSIGDPAQSSASLSVPRKQTAPVRGSGAGSATGLKA